MMKKSTMKAVTFQRKEGVDSKTVEMGTVAEWNSHSHEQFVCFFVKCILRDVYWL